MRQTALFTNHLTEGFKPAWGAYPRFQLKLELHQGETGVDETVSDFMDDTDIFEENGTGVVTLRVQMKIVDIMARDRGRRRIFTTRFLKAFRTGWRNVMLPRNSGGPMRISAWN